MHILPLDLGNEKQVEDFLHLPFSIYKDNLQWVPPLRQDERFRLNTKRLPFYKHSQALFLLAYEGTRPIGRLAILNNRRYNEYNKHQTAFFYLFELENHPAAAKTLFEEGFAWARSQGLNRSAGPKGFTPMDGMGMLVRGFRIPACKASGTVRSAQAAAQEFPISA